MATGLDRITRKIEFDAGHRIPDHNSKCKNAHGHRYTLEATVAGPLQEEGSATGMVTDFGDLKALMMELVGEPWDHAFLVFDKDHDMIEALEFLGTGHKTVMLPSVPTVENLARIAFDRLSLAMPRNVCLICVRLYETPNCWADAYVR